MSRYRESRLFAVMAAAALVAFSPAAIPQGAAASLEALEGRLRTCGDGASREAAARAYREALEKAGDLEAVLPLNPVERELASVIGIEKSVRAGPYGRHVGRHVVVLAPERWLLALGAERARHFATLDTGFVLLEDLTGADLAKARGRRLFIAFTPDHPPGMAQTLEAVVWAGFGCMSVPPDFQVLFHEMGHELFPAPNLRPRHETFNEMWPELGRQYVSWFLGLRSEFEAQRRTFLAAFEERHRRPGLPLEMLAPYEVGGGMLQAVVDAALRRDGGGYEWEPLRAFFRKAAAVGSETGSFFQKQESLAFLLQDSLGEAAREPLRAAGFDLRPERLEAIPEEHAKAAPLHAAVRAALARGDGNAAASGVDRLFRKHPASAWAADAAVLLAGWHAGAGRDDEAFAALGRAGHRTRWRVVGPFAGPRGTAAGPFSASGGVPDPEAPMESVAGPVRWREVRPRLASGYVDLDALFAPNEGVHAFALAEVDSPRGGPALLWTGSDDAIAVFVNGEAVFRKPFPRGCFPDTERVEITLRPGRNVLLLEIGEYSGGWGFTARLTDASGRPLP